MCGCGSSAKVCTPLKKQSMMKTALLDFPGFSMASPTARQIELAQAYTVQTGVGFPFIPGEGILIIPKTPVSPIVPRISDQANIVGASLIIPTQLPMTTGPLLLNFTDGAYQFGAFAFNSDFDSSIPKGEAVLGLWSATGAPLYNIYEFYSSETSPVGTFEVYYFI